MPYKFDFINGKVYQWTTTEDGATYEVDESYTPTLYVSAHKGRSLTEIEPTFSEHPQVEHTRYVEERISFRHEPSRVLRVDASNIDAVKRIAREVAAWADPGVYRLYNVDLSREYRYCLEEGIDPTPASDLSVLRLDVDDQALANEHITSLTVDGETLTGDREGVLTTLQSRVDEVNPDVLLVNTSDVIPALFTQAQSVGFDDFELGRLPGERYQQLAGRSTYTSYGRVGHSPARYNVPGRAIVNRSNTFTWNQTNLNSCLDLVSRSHKPLQELARSSIGSILTAIQIREARSRGVLVPWHSWRHEFPKTMRQLHDADRGGFTFAPDAGFHEDVHELDFSSLYPNIIVTRNVSPDKIRCDCHSNREDVPGLGYSICDERGFLPDVLEPLVSDRDDIKAELKEAEDPERIEALEGQSSAIKWILVSCFGYQGFSNAKFGRIECHEAINAYAREILLDAKDTFEANGWRVIHGIVDSIWVTAIEGEEQTPLEELVDEITADVGIRLEYEAAYDWIAFVPMRNSDAGALTKYFGKEAGVDEYKFRGIECRQRSTPQFIEDAQKDLIETLAETRDAEAVVERLKTWLGKLSRGDVSPDELLVKNRVSKSLSEYSQYTRNVAALERAKHLGIPRHPGQSVQYVVVDDDKKSPERVRLAHESLEEYDDGFYRTQLLRAAESVLSPLGWREGAIERYLDEYRDVSLDAY
ncbi:type B DNA-directed DNA polymerase [Haloarchaeobius amylolyticus]|uniref:type B DNA-directed DNA polymerase n=1 Tax=Haloarchaeobius amylolyticus TaxID=1198296 RepID=UPI00227102D5